MGNTLFSSASAAPEPAKIQEAQPVVESKNVDPKQVEERLAKLKDAVFAMTMCKLFAHDLQLETASAVEAVRTRSEFDHEIERYLKDRVLINPDAVSTVTDRVMQTLQKSS